MSDEKNCPHINILPHKLFVNKKKKLLMKYKLLVPNLKIYLDQILIIFTPRKNQILEVVPTAKSRIKNTKQF